MLRKKRQLVIYSLLILVLLLLLPVFLGMVAAQRHRNKQRLTVGWVHSIVSGDFRLHIDPIGYHGEIVIFNLLVPVLGQVDEFALFVSLTLLSFGVTVAAFITLPLIELNLGAVKLHKVHCIQGNYF